MDAFFKSNVPLKDYTTFRLGGRARYLAFAYDFDGLLRALELSENRFILGKGSKLLISDSGFDGVVIAMRMQAIRFGDKSTKDIACFDTLRGDKTKNKFCDSIASDEIYAEAGVSLPVLSRIYAAKSLTGLEWASLIPASVGGALRLNAGAHNGDMSGITLYVDILRKGQIVRVPHNKCGFSYRFSAFYPSDIILGAGLKAKKGDRTQIEDLIKENNKKRKEAQPVGFSCGSVFKRADKPAYVYINGCNLKGLSVGKAKISEKHANFIINTGEALASDVYTLIRTIKSEVYNKFNVKLYEEVIYVGDF